MHAASLPCLSAEFLCLHSAGIQIEEPFHVLPMHSYCAVIAKNALEVARERKGDVRSTITNCTLTILFKEFVKTLSLEMSSS